MRFRKLRIAFPATCLIACVLLIVLWVRSYSRSQVLIASDARAVLNMFVERGVFGAAYSGLPSWSQLQLNAYSRSVTDKEKLPGYAGFYWGTHPVSRSYSLMLIPIWFVVILVAVAGMLPSLRWSKRFSLRTLLITTTLIALVLGAFAYAAR